MLISTLHAGLIIYFPYSSLSLIEHLVGLGGFIMLAFGQCERICLCPYKNEIERYFYTQIQVYHPRE